MAELVPVMEISAAMFAADRDYRKASAAWTAALRDAGAATLAQALIARRRLHRAELDLRDAESALAGATSLVLRDLVRSRCCQEGGILGAGTPQRCEYEHGHAGPHSFEPDEGSGG